MRKPRISHICGKDADIEQRYIFLSYISNAKYKILKLFLNTVIIRSVREYRNCRYPSFQAGSQI